jgi:hypothetical protein
MTSLTYLVVEFINLGLTDASLDFHYGCDLVSRDDCTHGLIQIKVLFCSERSTCNAVLESALDIAIRNSAACVVYVVHPHFP